MRHYLPSSILKTELNDEQIDKINEYFGNLTVTEAEMITLSKTHAATKISYEKIAKIFLKCVNDGIFSLRYAIKCPECGRLIKEFSEHDVEKAYKLKTCYICNSDITVKDTDIIAIFSIVYNSPFYSGQNQKNAIDKKGSFDSAPWDTYSYLREIAQELKLSNEIAQRKEVKEDKKEKQNSTYEKKAYKISKRNEKIRLLFNISNAILFGLIIYYVVSHIESSRVSATVSGFTYMISFVFNNIFVYFFPVDINKIILKLKNEK